LIAQIQVGQMSYYLVDGLGSTRLLTDGLGQVLNSYGYEAFGETTSQSGTASNKYQFAGEQFDSALGDYYLRQRFYDTSSGRFGRMDTYQGGQGNPLTLHKYSYTHNNPGNGNDPTGLFTIAEYSAAESIRKILAGGQANSTTYLFSSAQKGSGYSPGDFLKDIAQEGMSEFFPILSLFLGVFGVGGGGSGGNTSTTITSSGQAQPEYIFRGDGRPPEEVFKTGLTARDQTTPVTYQDFIDHVDGRQKDLNNIISTSKDIRVGKDWGAGNATGSTGWVYIIRNPGNGFDVNQNTGRNYVDQEISFAHNIPPHYILAAKPIDASTERFRGRIIKNSFFRRG
jgi:RHS repeat-associated protein